MCVCLLLGQCAGFSVCLQVIRQFGLRSQPGGVQPVASSTSPHLSPSLTNEAFVSSITNVSQCRIPSHTRAYFYPLCLFLRDVCISYKLLKWTDFLSINRWFYSLFFSVAIWHCFCNKLLLSVMFAPR